ncbi:MAG: NUDIX domain-containing protein [Oscillospiraceae bacterium]|nr:NUDIX domain-containing protein [Oscillospiraceae bacterium]
MLKVKFYDSVDDSLLKFAVIVSKHDGKWVFCKHKDRDTFECPGGHREQNENITDTAKRELYEETGADDYSLTPVCVYSVASDTAETCGMLYFADIHSFSELPPSEIEKVLLFDDLPADWTYPLIQPKLVEKVKQVINIK